MSHKSLRYDFELRPYYEKENKLERKKIHRKGRKAIKRKIKLKDSTIATI